MADLSEVFLTTAQLAVLRHVNPKTLERERLRGDGPPLVRTNGKTLYRRKDVDGWLASRTFQHRAAEATGQAA